MAEKHPLEELAEQLPAGWDYNRLYGCIAKIGKQGINVTDEEKVIGLLAYVVTKRTYAARSNAATAERRREEIERITGEPYEGVGRAKTYDEVRNSAWRRLFKRW